MKTRIEQKVIPATTEDETIYACDHCNFTSGDEGDVLGHEARTHTKSCEIAGETGYWFDTEEQARLFVEHVDAHHLVWGGPGWYLIRPEEQYFRGEWDWEDVCRLARDVFEQNKAKAEKLIEKATEDRASAERALAQLNAEA